MQTIPLHQLFCSVFASLLGLGLVSCSSKPPGNVLARVGDAEITKETFLSELEIRARRGQSVGTPEDQKSILEDMIQLEMLVAKATAAGLDRDPEIARQYKQMLATGFEQRERARLAPVGEPEDGAIELFYEQQRKQFTIPEKIHVAMILTKVPSKAGAEQVQVRILAFSPAVVPHGYEGEGVAVVERN